MLIMAASACCQIYLAFHGGIQDESRLQMSYGSLGNSNDLATALLMGLPYIVYFIADKKLAVIFRPFFLIPAILLFIVVLKTGSRGALVAIAVLTFIVFLRSSVLGKGLILVIILLFSALFVVVVPQNLKERYMTIFKSDRSNATQQSALDSSNARREIFKNSLILTAKHPLFGVGLGQFGTQSFNLFVARGMPGMWFTSHDIFALIAAELGVPALIFYCALLWVCFRALLRLSRVGRDTPEKALISNMGYCMLMSLVAFVVCGIFSTEAYTYQLPGLASLTVALERIAAPYVVAGATSAPTRLPMLPPFVNRRLAQGRIPAAS
jgi:O-antigen ligase